MRAHAETVLRRFYDFHLEAGSGPIVNPFPLDRSRRGGRAHAHHNPMDRYRDERAGLYRPSLPSRIPRSVPDAEFNEVFARLPSNRDRALATFYVSTGARASELLSAVQGGVHPGRQVIAVTRKGTRLVQELPASPDAFVWLPLYRMAEDPALPLTDVQWVLGHAQLTTTQVHLTPHREDVIRRMLAHHGEQARQAAARQAPVPASR